MKAFPSEEVRKNRGAYTFDYQVTGSISGITKDTLTITIVPLEEAIRINAEEVKVGDKNVVIKVRNLQNTALEEVEISISSAFFEGSKTISLEPFSSDEFSIRIDGEKLRTLPAGQYILNSRVTMGGKESTIEGRISYVEKETMVLSRESTGFLIRKTTMTRTNEGNVEAIGQLETSRDALSRLFTTHSATPTEISRRGFYVKYIWEKNLKPGESFSVNLTTNYIFPFLIILLIVAIAFFVRMYTTTNMTIEKRVSFVKTKGGEFALKVRLNVKARKYIENIKIIDRLPGMTKLYEKFGIAPDKIDEKNRQLIWNIPRLNAGEERVYSYVIYSKVKVFGRFELPSASAIFQRDGKTESIQSNRTFFVSDGERKE